MSKEIISYKNISVIKTTSFIVLAVMVVSIILVLYKPVSLEYYIIQLNHNENKLKYIKPLLQLGSDGEKAVYNYFNQNNTGWGRPKSGFVAKVQPDNISIEGDCACIINIVLLNITNHVIELGELYPKLTHPEYDNYSYQFENSGFAGRNNDSPNKVIIEAGGYYILRTKLVVKSLKDYFKVKWGSPPYNGKEIKGVIANNGILVQFHELDSYYGKIFMYEKKFNTRIAVVIAMGPGKYIKTNYLVLKYKE